jgi:hypothetical protein
MKKLKCYIFNITVMIKIGFIFCLCLFLTSCSSFAPNTIGFDEAMSDLSSGFAVLRDTAPKQGERVLGLVPSQVTATFKLTTTKNRELGINLSEASFPGFPGIFGANAKATGQAVRDNTVTITFVNVYYDKDGKLQVTAPKESGPTILQGNPIAAQSMRN